MSDSVTPWTAACQASLSFTISWGLLKLMSTESVMPSNHLTLCHPLLLLPSIFPSIRVFSNESAVCIRWPKHWSFNFSISPSDEYSGLISLRMDWLDVLAGQGTLRSLLSTTVQRTLLYCCTTVFLTTLPFFLHPLSSLVNNCLNLLFGTQGRSRRLKPFLYQRETGDTESLFVPGGPHRVLPSFKMVPLQAELWPP